MLVAQILRNFELSIPKSPDGRFRLLFKPTNASHRRRSFFWRGLEFHYRESYN